MEDPAREGPSADAVRDTVLDDLRVASMQMENIVASDSIIRPWLDRNGITPGSITSGT